MSHPLFHARNSVRKWGGQVEDYLPIHNWFDETKALMADFRHRALRHHAEGIFLCETIFGVSTTIHLTDGTFRNIPTRWVAEQHVKEDFGGKIPTAVDWLKAIRPEPWMAPRIDREEVLD